MGDYRPYKQATVILYILDALDCLAVAVLIVHFARAKAISIPVLIYCVLATGACFHLHVCTSMRVALDKEGVTIFCMLRRNPTRFTWQEVCGVEIVRNLKGARFWLLSTRELRENEKKKLIGLPSFGWQKYGGIAIPQGDTPQKVLQFEEILKANIPNWVDYT